MSEATTPNTTTAEAGRVDPVVRHSLIERSEKVLSICRPRWEGKGNTPKIDPCGGCPLYDPCVNKSPVVPGAEAFNSWVGGINAMAETAHT